jgi:RHS repeat-associated protein
VSGQTVIYNLRFAGQYYQAETGLVQNYFRDYDPQTGRYIESDPIGLAGGSFSTYAYADGNPISESDPSGLLAFSQILNNLAGVLYISTGYTPSQGLTDYSAGLGDTASLNASSFVRDLNGTNDLVNKCSPDYRNGALTTLALGAGRLAYAGLAKVGSIFAASGAEASAFRAGLRRAFGGGPTLRPPDLSKYATDDALQAAAGRTNLPLNLTGAAVAATGAAKASGCGCN